jgi:hypothetical protein
MAQNKQLNETNIWSFISFNEIYGIILLIPSYTVFIISSAYSPVGFSTNLYREMGSANASALQISLELCIPEK